MNTDGKLTIRTSMIALMLSPFCAIALNFTEQKGLTKVFNLSAGTKAHWSKDTSTIPNIPITPSSMPRISLSPNPAGQTIHIQFDGGDKNSKFSIYSIDGKKVFSVNFPNKTMMTLNHHLPNGIYLARITHADRIVSNFRFIVLR